MDPSTPAAATLVPAPALAHTPLAFPGPLGPSLLSSSGQGHESERGDCLWRPWLSSTDEPARPLPVELAADGAPAAEVTKADSGFHHPVRLYWPKSRSFDYLYSAGEILLQHFPVQATINLYEDSDSEEEEEEEEEEEDGDDKEEKEGAQQKGPEGCVRVPGSSPHRATASPPMTCPN